MSASPPDDRRVLTTRRAILRAGSIVAANVVAMPFIARFSPALAAWPDRPIRLVVPFGPGGPVDVIARLMAPGLSEALKTSVVVENKPGAGGNIGNAAVARADPDGYTVLCTSSTLVINPMLYASVPYDPVKDFLPVADLAGSPTAFAVQPSLGVKTLAEFVEYAKQRKGQLSYAHSGFATPAHLAGEFFKIRAGLDLTAVPFSGGGPAVQSLLTGAVQMVSTALPGVHPHIVAGTLTGIGMTGEKRWFDLPQVPTIVEAGYPGFVVDTFTAMLLPVKTPQGIADRLTKECITILQNPDMKARLRTVGFEASAGGPDALRDRIARELPMWKGIIQQAKIVPP